MERQIRLLILHTRPVAPPLTLDFDRYCDDDALFTFLYVYGLGHLWIEASDGMHLSSWPIVSLLITAPFAVRPGLSPIIDHTEQGSM